MKKFFLTIIVFFVYTSCVGWAQTESILLHRDKISKLLENYSSSILSNKLFIHFDKENYIAGENIWLKAYLFSYQNSKLDTIPANLYIEMYDYTGKPVLNSLFELKGGHAFGYISLNNTLPDGNYFIRAYTDIMNNTGEEGFFYHYFYLENKAYENRISSKEVRFNRDFNTKLLSKKGEINLSIFPEGGEMVLGIPARLIVKSKNGLGEPIEGEGKLVNSKKQVIEVFKTSEYGLASINYTPNKDEDYFIDFTSSLGVVSVPVPRASEEGAILSLEVDSFQNIKGTIYIQTPKNEFVLIARMGYKLLYHQHISTETLEPLKVSISSANFGTGVAIFELYDLSGRLLSYRPAYFNRDDQTYIKPRSRVQQLENDRVVAIGVNTIDSEGLPIPSNLSVSVTVGNISHPAKRNDIFKELHLLSYFSHLNHIPSQLLSLDDDEMSHQLDMLLITGKYSEVNLTDLIGGEVPASNNQRAFGAALRGLITDPTSNQPVSGVNLQLKQSYGDQKVYRSKSKDDGIFEFTGLIISDSVKIEIATDVISGGIRPTVSILPNDQGNIEYIMNPKTQPHSVLNRGKRINRVRTRSTSQASVSPFGNPDQTIVISDKVVHRNLLQVLMERGIGLIFVGNELMFRGPSSILSSNEPLFIKDGVVASSGEFLDQDPRDVERIELFRGASAGFWGVRGANGVIVSYGKRGTPVPKPFSEFIVQGFSFPEAFFADTELILERLSDQAPQTIFWNPLLKTDLNGNANFFFIHIPNTSGYRIDIQGFSEDGTVAMGSFIIGK